ncbi:aldehyde dehydrogenase family protein [Dactylosporangium sp. CA-233914]|uniref:aldehyde dehydrogenase family protein n=1 Tax=Dactylosporangium sp. CA-233914 TaxID=3239934 RepID=UPI003D8BD6C3
MLVDEGVHEARHPLHRDARGVLVDQEERRRFLLAGGGQQDQEVRVVRLGGAEPDGPGYYYPATVLTAVDPLARIMTEEPFGPIAPICAYDDDAHAVDLANATECGLAAYVFGETRQATALGRRLNAGSVSINSAPGAAPDAPLGGRLASGYGYEGGDQGLLAFTRSKICQQDPAG